MTKHSVRSIAWSAAGLCAFALGAIGAVVPLLPTTPFLLLSALCFARSSERMNNWFRSTKLYRTYLENYLSRRPMTLAAKLKIFLPTTVLLGISFFAMADIAIGRIIVASIWVGHLVYLGLIVKTERKPGKAAASDIEPA